MRLLAVCFSAIFSKYYWGCPCRFEFEKELDLASLTQKANIDAVVASHVPIADDYWYDTYGIDKPANYAELKTAMQQAKAVDGEQQQQDAAQKTSAPKGKKPIKPQPGSLPENANLSSWDNLRIKLADFFAHAHKD
ncbi:MAG: hypothetical protein EAY75_06315 [Bacteroidetes bacterium]|nr:MAG: hypothetical protein EAY75_06315 [Bacteroidota bacterium]